MVARAVWVVANVLLQ